MSARRARRSWPQRLILVLGVFITAAAVIAASGVWWAGQKLGDVETIPLAGALTPVTTLPGGPKTVENYLIVGSDSREGADPSDPDYDSMGPDSSPRRSDTIMVLRFDPATNEAAILSLPRDLYVSIPGKEQKNRINTAFSAGEDVLIKAIEQNFDIPVHHYVEVDFEGFKRIVDAVGGVSMYFDAPTRDKNTGLNITSAGCHTLDGVQALQLARSRHYERLVKGKWREDGTADLGRIDRQQDFIQRALQKAVKKSTTNPLVAARLLSAAVDNVRVDDQLDLAALASRLTSLSGDFERYTFPADGKVVRDMAVLVPDMEKAAPILARFRGQGAGKAGPGAARPLVAAASGTSTPSTTAVPSCD